MGQSFWRGVRGFLLALVFVLTGWPVRADAQEVVVNLSPQVLRSSALFYREFHSEFLFCLYGRAYADTVDVSLAAPANVRPSQADESSVAVDADTELCIPAGVVGTLHSHPGSGLLCDHTMRAGPGATLTKLEPCLPGEVPIHACMSSLTDVATFEQSPWPLELIVCGIGRIMIYTHEGAALCIYNPEAFEPACLPTEDAESKT